MLGVGDFPEFALEEVKLKFKGLTMFLVKLHRRQWQVGGGGSSDPCCFDGYGGDDGQQLLRMRIGVRKNLGRRQRELKL